MKRYDHGVSISFAVDSDSESSPTDDEILDKLRELLKDDPYGLICAADVFDTRDREQEEA